MRVHIELFVRTAVQGFIKMSNTTIENIVGTTMCKIPDNYILVNEGLLVTLGFFIFLMVVVLGIVWICLIDKT